MKVHVKRKSNLVEEPGGHLVAAEPVEQQPVAGGAVGGVEGRPEKEQRDGGRQLRAEARQQLANRWRSAPLRVLGLVLAYAHVHFAQVLSAAK